MPMVHATCVEWLGCGILIQGKPGSGKSDLALRLIEAGAVLVSDDQVHLDGSIATAPETIQGMLEIRGVGIVQFPFIPQTKIRLIVDLCAHDKIDRLPIDTPPNTIKIEPFSDSAIIKIKIALQILLGERSLIL